VKKPITWTIAGSDSSGGAGIQADLKTMNALGTMGCSVITALTAQNTLGITEIEYPSESMLAGQISALKADLPPAAVKIGMLGNAANIETIARHLIPLNTFIVFDPVLISSTGHALFELKAIQVLISRLLPLVHLLTPNIGEAETLLGHKIEGEGEMEAAALELLKLGIQSVLIKGGHLRGDYCRDFWTNGVRQAWLTSPRQYVTHTHGTGCTLSSAIAACRALGYNELDAVIVAKAYVNQGLRKGANVGKGRGPIAQEGWPDSPDDLPGVGKTWTWAAAINFPDCGTAPLGFYPIVDRAEWLEALLPVGVRTIQLRIKDRNDEALEKEIRNAVAIARRFDARLFINDHWKFALKHGAYGVHLGRDDLCNADLPTLSRAGIRLGVSVRSYLDAACVTGLRPSYTAIGSIYATDSKAIDYKPVGVEEFARLRRLIRGPVVAIGGITLEKAAELKNAGADGLAVISDVLNASDPVARAGNWLEFWNTPNLKSKVPGPRSEQ
jgi:hydroxymethylpyrimidine kinase / phosphomethylpyrimidine kinase / thiamine-phosphate diphosphorylase